MQRFRVISHESLVFLKREQIQVERDKLHSIPQESIAELFHTICHRKYSGQHNQFDIRATPDGIGFPVF